MRAMTIIAMLIVGFASVFVGVGEITAMLLGYLGAVIVLAFVVPGVARALAASGIALALVFAIVATQVDSPKECSPPNVYIPLLSDVGRVALGACPDPVAAAQPSRGRLILGAVVTGLVGCAGVGAVVVARPRRRPPRPVPRDPGIPRG